MPAGTSLVVHVQDASGAVLSNAQITVRAVDEEPSSNWSSFGRWAPSDTDPDHVAARSTDAWGRAAIPSLGTGRFLVVATAPGLTRAVDEIVSIDGAPPAEITLTLRASAALAGRVMTKSGVPVGGVLVVVAAPGTSTGPSDPSSHFRARAAADGSWRVEGLAPGRSDVWVLRAGAKWDSAAAVRIPEVTVLDVVVPDGGSMTGRVVTPDGAPVTAAEVALRKDGSGSRGYEVGKATTDAEGRYTLTTFEDETEFDTITVTHDAWRWDPSKDPGHANRPDSITSGDVVHCDFVLQPAARIAGTVTGPSGPVPDAHVYVWQRGGPPWNEAMSVSARTDTAGRWALGGLAGKTVGVQVCAPHLRQADFPEDWSSDRRGAVDHLPETVRRTLRAGETATFDVTMTAAPVEQAPGSFAIAGVVLDETGRPIASARVLAGYDSPTYTRADGTFSTTFVGRHGWARMVTVSARGFVDAEKCVAQPKDEVRNEMTQWVEDDARSKGVHLPYEERERIEFRLRRAPVVRGTVTSSLGLPVAGARVLVAQHQYDRHGGSHVDWFNVPGGVVAADGTYEIPLPDTTDGESVGGGMLGSLVPEYAVCIDADGHAPSIGPSVTRVAGTEEYVADFVLGAGARVAGRVVAAADGSPIAAAPISVSPHRGFGGAWNDGSWPPAFPPVQDQTIESVSGADGSFAIESLIPGVYSIGTAVPGWAPEWRETTIPAAESVTLSLRVVREVGVVVLGPDERPAAGARVEITLEDDDSWRHDRTRQTGADGACRFTGITPGRWRVFATRNGLAPVASDWTPETTTKVVLRMARGLEITGRVVDADGAPVPKLEVRCAANDARRDGRHEETTDDDGRFKFGPLAPGTFDVTFPELAVTRDGVEAGTDVAVALTGRSRIAGRLLGAEGDGYYAYEDVRIRPAAGGPEREVRTDERGRFEFRGLEPGIYDVSAERRWTERGDKTERVVRLPPGQSIVAGTTDAELRLR